MTEIEAKAIAVSLAITFLLFIAGMIDIELKHRNFNKEMKDFMKKANEALFNLPDSPKRGDGHE